MFWGKKEAHVGEKGGRDPFLLVDNQEMFCKEVTY